MNPSGAWTPGDEKQRKQNNTIRLLIEQAEPVTDRDCQAPCEAGSETGLPYPFIRSDFDGAFSLPLPRWTMLDHDCFVR